MKITAIRTPKVLPGVQQLTELLDATLPPLRENTVVAVTSKIVALCENRVVPIEGTNREQLIHAEAEYYYDAQVPYTDRTYHFTITQNTLIPASGIDASNSNGNYVLWPADPIASASTIRRHLIAKHHLRHLGVIITDSTIGLSRWGTLGITIGHSGFAATKNYIGQPDLFGRTLQLSQANVAGGLAAAAVLAMGEGAEQTPLALIENPPGTQFQDHDPAPEDQAAYYISPLNDEPFRPFFSHIPWRPGGKFQPPLN